MSNKHKIGIIGVGFVGGALLKYFSSKGGPLSAGQAGVSGRKTRPVKLFVYDKYKHLGSAEQVNKADVIFIATPTPFHPTKGFDISSVKQAISIIGGKKIVVIKSSIVPGTTAALQKQFPHHKILFNPEFLREVSAYQDMINPDRQLVGVTKRSKSAAALVMKLLPKAPFEKIMPAEEAEMVKYMANSFLALKVVFGNEFYNICKALDIDYDQVRQAVVKDPRIGDSHFDVAHGGYRGYGGSCFPKDVNAIMQAAKAKKISTPLLKSMREINQKLLKKSGYSEEFFLKNKHKQKKVS